MMWPKPLQKAGLSIIRMPVATITIIMKMAVTAMAVKALVTVVIVADEILKHPSYQFTSTRKYIKH